MKRNLIIVLVFAAFLTACKKEETNTNTTDNSNVPKGTLTFHLHNYIDENEVDLYNIVYTTDEGREMSLSMGQLYISDIRLVKLDGSTYAVPSKKILKVQGTESYVAGEVPIGNYKTIRFKVGLDASTNALQPSADTALLNHANMWFSSSTQPDGYVFLHAAGTIDTSADLSSKMASFSYKIGSATHYVEVELPERNFSIMKNQTTYSHLRVNYNKLFQGVNLSDINNLSVQSLNDNTGNVAQKIANNIPSIFIYE